MIYADRAARAASDLYQTTYSLGIRALVLWWLTLIGGITMVVASAIVWKMDWVPSCVFCDDKRNHPTAMTGHYIAAFVFGAIFIAIAVLAMFAYKMCSCPPKNSDPAWHWTILQGVDLAGITLGIVSLLWGATYIIVGTIFSVIYFQFMLPCWFGCFVGCFQICNFCCIRRQIQKDREISTLLVMEPPVSVAIFYPQAAQIYNPPVPVNMVAISNPGPAVVAPGSVDNFLI